jgi:hypothetical protein
MEKERQEKKRGRRWLDAAFLALWVAVFCSGLGFKASARFLGWPRWSEWETRENRRLAEFPRFRELPAKAWGRAVDGWYGDQFAWRAALLEAHRTVHLRWLKTGLGGQVPGRGGWVFRRGGDWAETEDYLGALELTKEELDGWRTQLEGRVAWAEAHGMGYVEFITPVKARIHPEKMMPWLAAHKGTNMADQVRGALEGSPAAPHVVFFEDEVAAETAARGPLYYLDDHHPNAFGAYLLYGAIRCAVEREAGRELAPMPPWFGDAPPPEVEREEAEGCFERDGRLCVREPGQHEARTGLFGALKAPGGVGAARSRRVVNDNAEDGAVRVVIAHDSFLRFPLSSWHFEKDRVRFPLGRGVRDVYSVMWGRFNTDRLETLAGLSAEDRPDVLVEQFPDIKLNFGIHPDETMRRAAAWGAGEEVGEAGAAPGDMVAVRVRLHGVEAGGEATVRLAAAEGGETMGEWAAKSGPVRAFFSDAFAWPEGGVRVELDGATAEGAPEVRVRRVAGE